MKELTRKRRRGWKKHWLVELQDRTNLRKDVQTSLLGNVLLVAAIQIGAALALLYQLFNFNMKPMSATIVATRFICGLVFHIYLQAEFKQGQTNMKYALNHPWKFEWPTLAFFVGLMQSCVVFVIELINYILIVGSNTYLEIILATLALYFIINFSNFFYQQPMMGGELKKVITGVHDKYENFLRWQVKANPRFTIFRTQKQQVEMLPPLKEEVADDIPYYNKLDFSHRSRWTCNRSLRVVFLVQYALYLANWFYYAPFLAICVNFTVPFLQETFGGFVDNTEAGEMSGDYKDFVDKMISESGGDYDEPSLEAMVKLMDDTPLQSGFKQDPETLVLPLSLESFWDAFWADEAPYYVEAIERDKEDGLSSSTAWGPPTVVTELDKPVLEERTMKKSIRTRSAFAPDHTGLDMRISLLEKSDTSIMIKESHTSDAPYGDTFRVWIVWEAKTEDSKSFQTVIRKSY